MGHQPRGGGRLPTAESFHLGIALSAYLGGKIDVDEFERNVEHVLRGGCLNQFGRIGGQPAPRDLANVESR